jgi:hypothetical protein
MIALRIVLATALAVVATAAGAQPGAMSDNNGAPAPNPYAQPFFVPDRPIDRHDKQCFNGKFLSGANRIGDKVVLLQSARSDVFRVELKQPCPAIEAARKLRVPLVTSPSAGTKRCSGEDADRTRRGLDQAEAEHDPCRQHARVPPTIGDQHMTAWARPPLAPSP